MNKYKEIDEKNTYIPNLNIIQESSIRQFFEGNFFLEMAKETVDKYYSIDDKEIIYDLSNTIASTLAFACESFLKALYIYENNTKDNDIDSLWEKLKKPEKIDATRNKKKVKGHDLDILIDNLSLDSKTLIETRLLTINTEQTEKHEKVTIYDILLKNNKIKRLNLLEETKYYSWLEHHKRTFEKSRYGGQIYHKVNLEFLFHLATQICAVAQYKICPTEMQKKLKKFEHIEELPNEVITLFHLKNDFLDEKLINLISKNKEKKEEFIRIVNNDTIMNMLIKHQSVGFYKIIKYFKYEEIEIIVNYIKNQNTKKNDIYYPKQNIIIPIKSIFIICFIASTEYRIDITESSLIEIINLWIKKDYNITDKNILKLEKFFPRQF